MLCDNSEQTIKRFHPNGIQPHSHFNINQRFETNYNSVNNFLNYNAHLHKGRVDLFDGSQDKPKLLATLENAKVISATPDILQKKWLYTGQLRGKIESQINGYNKKQLPKNHIDPPKQDRSKKTKRLRM